MISIREAKQMFEEQCNHLFEQNEGNEIFSRIIEHLTQKEKLEWKLDQSLQLSQNDLQGIITQLQTHKPIQQILGYEWFGELQLLVNEHVLIPRPETLELVLWIQEIFAQQENISLIDIGTGSACIPIWLKNAFPKWNMHALDISNEALHIAQLNASIYEHEIHFCQDDILDWKNEYRKFDVIVSNPPYITEYEKEAMNENVLLHEPHEALFVTNDDALQFYKAILQFALSHLNSHGQIFMEVNKDYANQVVALFKEQKFETEVRKDMYGNERMVRVYNKKRQ